MPIGVRDCFARLAAAQVNSCTRHRRTVRISYRPTDIPVGGRGTAYTQTCQERRVVDTARGVNNLVARSNRIAGDGRTGRTPPPVAFGINRFGSVVSKTNRVPRDIVLVNNVGGDRAGCLTAAQEYALAAISGEDVAGDCTVLRASVGSRISKARQRQPRNGVAAESISGKLNMLNASRRVQGCAR